MITPYLKVTHRTKIASLRCCCYGNLLSSQFEVTFLFNERKISNMWRVAGCIKYEEGWGQSNCCRIQQTSASHCFPASSGVTAADAMKVNSPSVSSTWIEVNISTRCSIPLQSFATFRRLAFLSISPTPSAMRSVAPRLTKTGDNQRMQSSTRRSPSLPPSLDLFCA